MILNEIDFEILKKALDIYLAISFPNGITEKNFCYKNIQLLLNTNNKNDFLNIFEKEKIKFENKQVKTKYIVRLGSESYPFMKLVLQETSIKNSYGFLVDRHTEYLAMTSSSKSFEDEKKVKQYTRKLKYKIEDEFAKNGVPTYREIVKNITKKLMQMKQKKAVKNNGIKVLIVEDDEDILTLYKINLELSGYTVSTALNGEIALDKVQHEYNHIMLLDLMMPTLSGFEIIKRIADEIPIIVISALNDRNSREECLKNGAKEMFQKPVEIRTLDKKIKTILNLKK